MTTMWKRMAVFLGMAEDEYDDDYDYGDGLDEHEADVAERERAPARGGGSARAAGESNVRRLSPARAALDDDRTAAVHAVPNTKVHLTDPTTFNDIEEVGERFRAGIPVIMNLGGASESVAKRMLDFASGLIYGLDGRIERVGDRVFLLTPTGVDVSTEERRRLSERGFFNQA